MPKNITKHKLQQLLDEKNAYARKIDHILDSMTDAFILLDTNWNIISNNKQVEKYFSLKKQELLGKNIVELNPQFTKTDFYKKISRGIKKKKRVVFETMYAPLNRWFAINAIPVKEGIAVYFTDITKRKETENNLRYLAALAENISDAIASMDLQFHFMTWNKASEKLYGWKKEEVIGKYATDVIPTEFPHTTNEVFRNQILKNGYWKGEAIQTKRTGEKIYIYASISAIKNSQGKMIGIVSINRDITKRIALERRKDEFISMASHELKTPITTIKAFTQILKRQFVKKEDVIISTYLTKMELQVDKLTNLITNMLEVSRTQEGRLQFHFDLFQLDEFVQNLIEDMQDTITTHIILLQGDFHKTVYGDKERISQVLLNLINNAVKYSPNAHKILITVTANASNIILGVKDYGIGIPEQHRARIFEKFYRVEDNNQRSHYPGLGVGLYISSEIVNKHGGKMWVDSKENKGSTFYFSLPIKQKNAI